METEIEIELELRGPLRLYNQFPRRYSADPESAIRGMIKDLPRIAKMGFNAVWMNPAQMPSKGTKRFEGKQVSGSLYAMADDEQLNPQLGFESNRLMREYVQVAKRNGLIPIFDLVLHHIGKPEIDQTTPVIKKLKDHLGAMDSKQWQDTIPIDYGAGNKDKINDIFNILWKPFIEKYIRVYGFMGVRFDAVSNMAEENNVPVLEEACKFIIDLCPKALLLGELMAANPKDFIEPLKNVPFTHVLLPGSFYNNYYEDNMPLWLRGQAQYLQDLTHNRGGVVGFPGNHDIGTLNSVCLLESGHFPTAYKPNGSIDHVFLKKLNKPKNTMENPVASIERLQEKILCNAIVGNGGWYLLAGDEFAVTHRPLVFSNYQESQTVANRWGGKANLTEYITHINQILSCLPEPKQGDQVNMGYKEYNGYWVRWIEKIPLGQPRVLIALTNDPQIDAKKLMSFLDKSYVQQDNVFILNSTTNELICSHAFITTQIAPNTL